MNNHVNTQWWGIVALLNPLALQISLVNRYVLNLIHPSHFAAIPSGFSQAHCTSVAKHRSFLPIFFLTIVSTWSYRERWISHRSIAS